MLKLGIIQLSIQEGNIEKNCAHIEELVRKHSSDDIDLLCFPELCISGYNFEKAIISHSRRPHLQWQPEQRQEAQPF